MHNKNVWRLIGFLGFMYSLVLLFIVGIIYIGHYTNFFEALDNLFRWTINFNTPRHQGRGLINLKWN